MIGKVIAEDKMKSLFWENGIIREGYNMSIPIGRLKACGFNTYEVEDVETLEREIRIAGLITPLTVIGPDGEGMYKILSGERRYRALLRIHGEDSSQFQEVNCFVCGTNDMDLTAQKLIMEIANVSVRKINEIPHRFSIVKMLKELSDKGYMGEWKIGKNLAEYLGVTPRYARCYKKVIFSGNPDLEKMVEDKVIDIKLAASISGLDKEIQEKFLERVKRGEDASKIYEKEFKKGAIEKTDDRAQEHECYDTKTIRKQLPHENPVPHEEDTIEEETDLTEQKKPIPRFDNSSFSTAKLKDIFNEYTGNQYEEAFHAETVVSASPEIDYARTLNDLNILLEKDTLTPDDEKLIEVCVCITEKYEL